MIRAIIFDYFDVIRPAGTGIRPTYRRLGGDVVKDEAFIADVTSAAGYGFINDANEQLASRLGVSLQTWLTALAGSPVNDPDLMGYILDLRAQGYRIGLLSNAPAEGLRTYFTPQELQAHFDATLVSGDVGLWKPEAAFYRTIAQKLGVEPQECVMVDDRREFCLGAEYIGMQSIQYKHYDQFCADLELLLANQSEVLAA